ATSHRRSRPMPAALVLLISRSLATTHRPALSTLFPYTTLFRSFGPLLEDKLCLIFKLAPSVCRMTFPILASLLVRLVMRHTLGRSEERFSRNAETELVCRLLLEKKKSAIAMQLAGDVDRTTVPVSLPN